MKPKRKTPGIRVCPPKGSHKTFRLQKQLEAEGKWHTVKSPELDALNALLLNGTLSLADAKARIKHILAELYRERDKNKPKDLVLPGNYKILEDFLEKTYTQTKRLRMLDESYSASVNYLKIALRSIGDIPVDGDVEALQTLLDTKYKDRPNLHEKRTTAINRLRKYLKLPYVQHLRDEDVQISHISKARVDELISKLDDPYKTMVAVAFYAGLRKGELFGLDESDIISDDVLAIRRQITPKGKTRKPKNKRERKAFVLPGGMKWVKAWLKLRGDREESKVNRHTNIGAAIDKHAKIRFHDLRHCYAVHLIGQGATLDWVAQSLGHSREVCERYYSGFVLADDAILLLRKIVATTESEKKKSKKSKKLA